MSTTGDKRSVSTDALETLGTIIGEGAGRDAIHIAVEPVIADIRLFPGQDVGLDASGRATSMVPPLGIVDPFLKQPVLPGDKFWLLVYPRQITSLRHVWAHPAFPDATSASASEGWLRSYAATFPVHYDELMERAADFVNSGEYWSEGGRFEGEYLNEEFWEHYQKVTGTIVPESKQHSFFSCSC